MYAIVEFKKGKDRTCAVVPLLWLVDNRTRCYWPRKATEKLFNIAVERRTPYAKSWPLYSVHRVLDTNADYEAIMDRLKEILDNGTSEDGGVTTQHIDMEPLVSNVEENGNSVIESQNENAETSTHRKRMHGSSTYSSSHSSDNENSTNESRKRRKHKKQRHQESKSKKRRHSTPEQPHNLQDSSSNGFGKDDDHSRHSIPQQNKHSQSDYTSGLMNTSCPGARSLEASTTEKVTKPATPRTGGNIPDRYITPHRLSDYMPDDLSAVLTPSLHRHPPTPRSSVNNPSSVQPMDNGAFQERVLNRLEQIYKEQEDQHQLITRILIMLEASLEPNKIPTGMPEFPLTDMASFEELDELLKSEVHFKYLKTRLSSIGGNCQRASVMSMMRFLLTNKLAMRFNWAGQNNKIRFKGVKVMAVIMDAAKVQFKGKHSSDKYIIDAVQSWLKLAKSRFLYESGKKA